MSIIVTIIGVLAAAISGALLRRVWGADQASKAAVGLGWVRQSYAKGAVIALSLLVALAGPWGALAALLVAGLHVLPWWLPWWGESNLAPPTHGGRWSRRVGAAVMGARFTLPALGIALVTGVWGFLAAGPLPLVAYWLAWRYVPHDDVAPLIAGPTDAGEAAAGALWFGALALIAFGR